MKRNFKLLRRPFTYMACIHGLTLFCCFVLYGFWRQKCRCVTVLSATVQSLSCRTAAMKNGKHTGRVKDCFKVISTFCWVWCRARKTTRERNPSQALQLWWGWMRVVVGRWGCQVQQNTAWKLDSKLNYRGRSSKPGQRFVTNWEIKDKAYVGSYYVLSRLIQIYLKRKI